MSIATVGIFDPNRARAASRSSTPLSEAQQSSYGLRAVSRQRLAAYRIAKGKGFEGIVAQDSDSLYEEGRSKKWLTVKVHQEEELS